MVAHRCDRREKGHRRSGLGVGQNLCCTRVRLRFRVWDRVWVRVRDRVKVRVRV